MTAFNQNSYQSPSISASLSSFWAMVRKEFTIMLRYPVEFLASFVQVFLIVIIFTLAGLMFSPEGAGGGASSEVTGVVSYGFILFLFLSDTLWSIGFNIRREQKQGTLEQIYMSPASKLAVLGSRVIITLIWTSILSVVAVWLLTNLLGDLPIHNIGLGLFVLIMALSGTFGTGFAFAALTLRVKESAQTAVNLLQFMFMIFCAPFFAFSALPEPLLWISRSIPLAYGVDLFRSTLMGFPNGFPELAPFGVELTIVTLFGIGMPILGIWLYQQAENHARRKGSLSEY
ncbi:MAG: ABC transporter permease [Chloroflexota bacterium]